MTLEELKEAVDKLADEYQTISNSGVAYTCVLLSCALLGMYSKNEIIRKLKEF